MRSLDIASISTSTATFPSVPDQGQLKRMPPDNSKRLGELQLIVVPSLFGGEIYVITGDGSPDTVAAIEQVVVAIGMRLQEVGLLSHSAFREALDDAGIITLSAHHITRVWDADRASANDTWKAFFPANAAHSRRSAVMTVDPTPRLEDIACALYLDSERQYLFPTDQIYVLSAEERERRLSESDADTYSSIFALAPLGVVLLPRSQFGGIATAFRRAFNLMRAAGYLIEVTD